MNLSEKIGLGTVQWGLNYGINNRSGQPSLDAVEKIIGVAQQAGIHLLDTAHAYGTAEQVIGHCRNSLTAFKVVTKTIPLKKRELNAADIEAVNAAFTQSMSHLHRAYVDGLMIHNADDLLASGGQDLWRALMDLKAAGRARKIGVSLYDPQQYRNIAKKFPVDLVQIPYNVYDRRFEHSGVMSEMKAANVEIHARSCFLQGILLMQPEELPAYFEPIRAHHASLQRWLQDNQITALAAALGVCLRNPSIDYVIIGCDTAAQLQQIVAAASAMGSADVPGRFALSDEAILNPSRWIQ